MLWICAGLSQSKLAANAPFILLELNPVPGQKELILEKGEICHTANLDKAEKMQMGRSCRRHSGDRPAAFSTCRRSQRADRWDSGSPQQSPVPRFPCRSAGHAGGQTALLAGPRARANKQPAERQRCGKQLYKNNDRPLEGFPGRRAGWRCPKFLSASC